MKSLEGKVALITGGAQGIGKKICERYLSEGADIAICDYNIKVAYDTVQELSGKSGSGKVKAFLMNVANETHVPTLRCLVASGE